MANRKDFGVIPYVTDKDYVVNSYHVDPRENIDAFTKLEIEGEYLALSAGGAVSYVETLDLSHNKEAIISIIQWMHEHIVYAEFNRKIGVCYQCGYEGDIELTKTTDGDFVFTCPCCGNQDDSKMNVVGRLCGYLGQISSGNTNKGRLDDIYHREIHLDCAEEATL
jgi:ribonucleoside-triphosphate reductase